MDRIPDNQTPRMQAVIALHAERPTVAAFIDRRVAELHVFALSTLPEAPCSLSSSQQQ